MAEPRRRRRRFVLSLRALLLVILVAALWLGSWVNRSRNQQAAVLAVTSSPYFANVIYDDDVDDFPRETPWGLRVGRKARSWVPGWVRARLGQDYFDNALAIAFSREDSGGPSSPVRAASLSPCRAGSGNPPGVPQPAIVPPAGSGAAPRLGMFGNGMAAGIAVAGEPSAGP